MKKKILLTSIFVPTVAALAISCSSSPSQDPIKKNETKIKSTIEASELGFSNQEANNALSSINELFIFNNKAIFLNGDNNLSSSSDIIQIQKEAQNNQIALTFSLVAKTWYDQNGNLGTDNKQFNTTITGFKPVSAGNLYFKNEDIFNWGDSNINTLDHSINQNYLKNKIIEHRNELLNISDPNKYNEQFFQQNLNITNYGKNNLEGFITIALQINDGNTSIQDNICIKGFKKFDESTITFPTLQNPTSPTDKDLEDVTNYINNMPLGINQYYFTQEQLNSLNSDLIYEKLIDLRTNKTPIFLTDAIENPSFEYTFTDIIIDSKNNLIKTKLYIWNLYDQSKHKSINKEFHYQLFASTEAARKDIIKKIEEKVKIIAKNDSYKNIKAKLFSRYNQSQIQQYFELNNKVIDELFWIEPEYLNVATLFTLYQNSYNFKMPTNLNFEIQVNYNGHPENSVKKMQLISGFKEVQTIGTLDQEPINILKTPQGAVSYKGELEKFYFDEFVTTTETNYRDVLKNMTYEDVKRDLIYHIRFYLYQMFSDNYSEINYYIKDEDLNKKTFVAVAEGIIKEDKANVFYGFQPYTSEKEFNNTSSVKKGDRIKLELTFNHEAPNDFNPTLFDRGEDWGFGYSWYWDYGDKCLTNILETKPPYLKTEIPRNHYFVRWLSAYINDNKTITGTKINQHTAPLFIKQFIIPKKNSNQ